MLVGKCPKCGAIHYGWALKSPESHACKTCGTELEISQDKMGTSAGYSLFTDVDSKITSEKNIETSKGSNDSPDRSLHTKKD